MYLARQGLLINKVSVDFVFASFVLKVFYAQHPKIFSFIDIFVT